MGRYNEKTGLLQAFNLGLESSRGGFQGTGDPCHEWTKFVSKSYDKLLDGQHTATVLASNIATWLSGTLVHVLFQYDDNKNDCNFAIAFLDRDEAELAFKEA